MNYFYIAAIVLIIIGLYLHFTLPTIQDPVEFQKAAINRSRLGSMLVVIAVFVGAYGYIKRDKN